MTSITHICNKLDNRRRALEMPLDELSRRANVSLRTVRRVLAGERGARFDAVSAIADALGVPVLDIDRARDIDEMRREQAVAKAKKLVGLVQGTSALEGQAVDELYIRHMVQKTINELLCGPRSRLWASL